MPFAMLADVTDLSTAFGTAISNVQTQITGYIGQVLPVALGIVGTILAITIGIKVLKKFTSK